MPTLAEQQFVALDKSVSSRYFDLIGRRSIAQQDLDSWWRDYQQLERFAESNSGDVRIRQGWSEEKPRYANSYSNLQAKVKPTEPFTPVYTPRLYDTSIRVSGNRCSGSGITQPTSSDYSGGSFAPVQPRDGSIINVAPSTYQMPSFGDALRSLFGIKPLDAPVIEPYPDSPLINQSEITSGVITAIVVGGILYVIHRATKKG